MGEQKNLNRFHIQGIEDIYFDIHFLGCGDGGDVIRAVIYSSLQDAFTPQFQEAKVIDAAAKIRKKAIAGKSVISRRLAQYRSLNFDMQATSMPLRLLCLLAQERLPVSVLDGEEVDAVRILVLAGHVRARIPLPLRTLSGGHHQPPATVTEVTRLGRQMIQRLTHLRRT